MNHIMDLYLFIYPLLLLISLITKPCKVLPTLNLHSLSVKQQQLSLNSLSYQAIMCSILVPTVSSIYPYILVQSVLVPFRSVFPRLMFHCVRKSLILKSMTIVMHICIYCLFYTLSSYIC